MDNIQIDGVAEIGRDTPFDDERYYRSGGIRLHCPMQAGALNGIKDGVLLEVGFDDVTPVYEGQLSRKEIKAREKAKDSNQPEATRPEITKAMQNYLDLHRHSAVRAELLNHQSIALRLAVAQMITGSELWTVYADPQKAANESIKESLTNNPSELQFEQQRQQVRELLGMKKSDDDTLVYQKDDWGQFHDLRIIFAKLRELDDEKVLTILTFVMAETLPAGTAIIDALGVMMDAKVDASLANDDTFFDLMKDKEAINAMLKQVAGKKTADANITATKISVLVTAHQDLSRTFLWSARAALCK